MGDEEAYIDALESQQNVSVGSDLSNQAYNSIQNGSQDNLVVFQLELDNILERIEHLLRGDIIREDAEGNISYVTPDDTTLIVMNDYGTQMVMNLLSFYLNRNTILSNYKEERIYEILFDLGNEFADLIYINYEKMGLNSVEKKSRYAFLVMNILHMVESAYFRALGGNELESLRSARVVTQNQPLGAQQFAPPQQKSGFSLNPFKRWS